MLGTCSQAPKKENQSVEFGIYWGPLFKSDSRSANGLQQKTLGACPNPRFPFHSGHIAGIHFPACLVVCCGHIPNFYPYFYVPLPDLVHISLPMVFALFSFWLVRAMWLPGQPWKPRVEDGSASISLGFLNDCSANLFTCSELFREQEINFYWDWAIIHVGAYLL